MAFQKNAGPVLEFRYSVVSLSGKKVPLPVVLSRDEVATEYPLIELRRSPCLPANIRGQGSRYPRLPATLRFAPGGLRGLF